MLFVNANNKQRNASLLVFRLAIMSTLRLVLLTTALCSLGSCGAASGGRADEKLHSSSSWAAAAAGAGVAGFGERDASAANGSDEWVGGEKADR